MGQYVVDVVKTMFGPHIEVERRLFPSLIPLRRRKIEIEKRNDSYMVLASSNYPLPIVLQYFSEITSIQNRRQQQLTFPLNYSEYTNDRQS